MIGYLAGTIKLVTPRSVLLNVHGVGYQIDMPVADIARAQTGADAEIFCHTHVREDALQLFGFFDAAARDFFEILIGVSGVGPKSALQILSIGTVDEIRAAVLRADITFLTRVPGIGKKIAERMVLDLRGKISDVLLTGEVDVATRDAVEALAQLGFKKEDAAAALKGVVGSTEELVRKGLKILHGKKI